MSEKKISKKQKIVYIISLIAIIVFLIFLTVQLLPIFQSLGSDEGRMKFKEEIEGLGAKGVLMIVGLMTCQVLLPILPGEPIEVLAGLCFGPMWGMIILFLGAFISAIIIIFAVRKFGRKFIYTFVSKERIEKIENAKIFNDPKKLDMIIFILFFIPGTPKDLFVYIGGLLPIKPWKFIVISQTARFPSIISSTIAGANIVEGNWGIIIAVYAISFIIGGIIAAIYMKKHPSIKEVM